MSKNFCDEYDNYTRRYNEELKKTGIFFAFSNEQFDENKTRKNAPNSEYLSVGLGGYIHKDDKEKLDKFFNITYKKLKDDLVSKIDIEDLIEYELDNHECYYVGTYEEIIPIIKDYYGDKEEDEIIDKIHKVYWKNLKKQEDYEME